jgi:hypothetical protein
VRARPAWLDVQRLLWFFGGAGGESRGRYAGFVESGIERAAVLA